ncbi:DUF6951 family protein [Candidatus Contubernalis alkaliaceticus]|uniref:DUF6951 family protein n=1 Tax=Candidatus Contubernalis alkaliaceticus TaxID=338645 RepID=UPI001F4C209D|nr:hypothetical protein [Candidatus Contubernalis alkalaceticus]UNC91786.1 hypothetical protein HUE98_06570 [Candidatus Contubernalis alkalaceticus]
MIVVEVDPGICGLMSKITVNSNDEKTAAVDITSDCPAVKAMGEDLKEVDSRKGCLSRIGGSPVYIAAGKRCHAACPVPMAIIKGIEAACGLAIPKDVTIKIYKE